MHGLINRAIQRFAEDACGAGVWAAAAAEALPGFTGFEAMLDYDDALTDAVLAALARHTGMPVGMLLEDLGVYLVSHPGTGALRRLLRFGGENFVEFLHSLDDLPDRARLAVPDLRLPPLALQDHATGRYTLAVGPGLPQFGRVLVGVLRAIADDYGTLALVELVAEGRDGARLSVAVAAADFTQGRAFQLGPGEAAG